MKSFALCLLVIIFYALHQDYWNWRTAAPLAFGFLPVGLWYHAVYALACAALLGLLVKVAWPKHLEQSVDPLQPGEKPR